MPFTVDSNPVLDMKSFVAIENSFKGQVQVMNWNKILMQICSGGTYLNTANQEMQGVAEDKEIHDKCETVPSAYVFENFFE